MAVSSFTLFGELKADTSGFKKSLREADAALVSTKNKIEGLEKAGRGIQNVGSGISSFGTSLTAAVTVPMVAAGAAAIKSAVDFDTLRTQLQAATGDTDSANKKFEELRKLSMANAGVMTSGAVATYAFLKPLGFMDETINETIKAFGKLKAANPSVDLQRMGTNLAQLFDQGFEMQDVKELFGNFPRAGEILKSVFGLSASDRSTVANEMKGLMAAGLTREDFFAQFAAGINNDKFLSNVTDPIAVRFEKMKERIMLAIEPLGLLILSTLERWMPTIIAFIERLSMGFQALSPTMQSLALIFAGIATAAGPVLWALGSLISTIGAIVGSASTLGIIAAVIAGIGVALVPVIAIAAFFYQAWVNNWDLVVALFETGKVKVLAVMAAIEAFWAEHGGRITEAATAWYTLLTDLIGSAMNIASEYVKLGLQVLQGDWAGAWDTVLQITSMVWETLINVVAQSGQIMVKAFQAVLPLLGQAMLWLVTKVTQLGMMVLDVFINLPKYIIALVPMFISAGLQIGEAIQKGIWNGIKSAVGMGTLTGQAGTSLGSSNPFAGILNSLQSMFGGGPGGMVTAGLSGSIGTLARPTFLTPIKNEAIQTSKALSDVAKNINKVKQVAKLADPNSLRVDGLKERLVYGNKVQFRDSDPNDPKAFLEVVVTDRSNGSASVRSGTSGDTRVRYR